MSEDQPLPGAPPPEGEREPAVFWGYGDLALVAGLSLPCLFLGQAIVWMLVWMLRLHSVPLGTKTVAAMLFGYCLLFSAVMVIFRVQYDRPFWRSLGWIPAGRPFVWWAICGFGTSMLVALVAWLLRIPPNNGPLVELMKNRQTLAILAIFGTTAAPLFEELAFRGFLQPVLVRSMGTVAGIGLASALFGAVHYSEYGDSWRSALVVGISGASFGCIRHFTGSTRASAIAHAAFNALAFVSLLAGKGMTP